MVIHKNGSRSQHHRLTGEYFENYEILQKNKPDIQKLYLSLDRGAGELCPCELEEGVQSYQHRTCTVPEQDEEELTDSKKRISNYLILQKDILI